MTADTNTRTGSRAAFQQAREIGFSRREILKYSLLGGVAMAVAACTGNTAATSPVEQFAVGTWKVDYTPVYLNEYPNTNTPEPPVSITLVINADGTYTTTGGHTSLPISGTWTKGNSLVQITGNRDPEYTHGVDYNETGIATNIPDTMTDTAAITWQWTNDTLTVPASWNTTTKTLTLSGTDGNGNTFPITAAKQ